MRCALSRALTSCFQSGRDSVVPLNSADRVVKGESSFRVGERKQQTHAFFYEEAKEAANLDSINVRLYTYSGHAIERGNGRSERFVNTRAARLRRMGALLF